MSETRGASRGSERSRLRYGWKKVAGGVAFGVLSIVATVLLARHLTSTSWPLQHAELWLVLVGAVAYLASFGFRALGWRRMFPPARGLPDRSRCLAACGAAAASGVVLPFRLDYLVKVSVLRRLRGDTLGLDTIVVSIVALGILDSVAMLPLAVSALATSGPVFRAPLTVVVLFCVGCLAVLVAGPRLARLPLIRRSRRATAVCERVGESAVVNRSTILAGMSLLACWTSRAFGSACLILALGGGFSPTLALVILCMAGATSILPITAGGAVVGMGATAGVLFALGAPKDVAINFPLASGLLLTIAALAAAVVGVAWSLAWSLRARLELRLAGTIGG